MDHRARQKVFHTWEINWGPLSDMMSAGIPWRRTTCCTIKSPVSVEYWRERASGLPFRDPGLYDREKLKRPRKRAHLACLGVSQLAEGRYSRLR